MTRCLYTYMYVYLIEQPAKVATVLMVFVVIFAQYHVIHQAFFIGMS